jgi:hypothetical protein
MWYLTLTGKSVLIQTAAGTDLSLKQTGEVVHKSTGGVVGSIKRVTDTPTMGTTTFITRDLAGNVIYKGVYKKAALAALAHKVTHAHNLSQVTITPVTSTVLKNPWTMPATSYVVPSMAGLSQMKTMAAPILENEALKQAFIGNVTAKHAEASVKKELVHGAWVVVEEPRKHGPMHVRPGEKCGNEVPLAITHPVLSPEEQQAANIYTGNGYVKMNKYIAAGDTFTGAYDLTTWEMENLPRLVVALREATRRAVVTHPFAVLRDIPAHAAMKVFGAVGSRIRQVMIERRFTSATKLPKDLGFGDVRLEYHVAPETGALDVHHLDISKHHEEHEIILAPEQRFRVVSDHVDTRRVIVLESA